MIQALLLSASREGDTPYLSHAIPFINKVMGKTKDVLFIPYAGVSINYDDYTKMVSDALAPAGYNIVGIHQFDSPIEAVKNAKAIFVGGGNTFHLLHELYRYELLDPIRQAVRGGTPYVGWSAGSNVAGDSIRTTNDMPIIQPPSFDALKLMPVQLNPHYTDYKPPGHNGETRQMRIEEFMTINKNMAVVGIEEGSALYLTDNTLNLWGDKQAYLFKSGNKATIEPNSDLSPLL